MDRLIGDLFGQAHAAGLSDCQVYQVSGVELYASTDGNQVTGDTTALCFEASQAGKTASVYTENLGAGEAAYLIRACLDQLSVLDAGAVRPLADGQGEISSFENYDPAAADPDRIRGLAQQMKDALAGCGAAGQRSGGVIRSVARTIRVCNDRGLDRSARHSYTFTVFHPIYESGGLMKTGSYFKGGNGPAGLDLPGLVSSSFEQAAAYQGAGRIATGAYPAILRNEAASHLLQSMAILFAKDLVDAGRSRFQNQLGQAAASPLVTLVDDPHLPGGIFSMPFDAQGVPTVRRELIRQGVLVELLCDLKTAEPERGLRPGCCTRSRYNLPAEISASNLYLQPGRSSAAELCSQMQAGVYITEVADYFPGHGLNLASGDFSLPAKGFVVRQGRQGEPFENVTLVGNLYEFLQGITGVADDLAFGEPVCLIPGMPFRSGAFGSPTLRVQGLKIAGG